MRMRQSTFTKDCLLSMQYTLDNPTLYFGGIKRAVGTGFHAGVERHYQQRMEGVFSDIPDHFFNAAYLALQDEIKRSGEHFKWDPDMPDLETGCEYMYKMLRQYFDDKLYWPTTFTVLGTEMSIDLPWHGTNTKGGSIDLVLLDANGWIIGVDHKTVGNMWPKGKEHPRKNGQGPWYSAALREMYPDAPGVRFVFDLISWKTGKFERRISDPSPAHEAATDAKALSVLALYQSAKANDVDLPANPGSNLCSPRYCDWWDVCPHGAVLAA